MPCHRDAAGGEAGQAGAPDEQHHRLYAPEDTGPRRGMSPNLYLGIILYLLPFISARITLNK